MTANFFKSLSIIFHPLLMPLLGMYLLFELPTLPDSLYLFDSLYFFPDMAKDRVYLVMAVLTFAAPLLSLLIMYWNKMITSLHLEKKEERVYPFFIVSFYYLLAYIFVAYQWPEELQHPAFVGFLFGMMLVFVITFILNFWFKISIHAVAVFGILGLVVAYYQTQLPAPETELLPYLRLIVFFAVLATIVLVVQVWQNAKSLKDAGLRLLLGFAGIWLTVKLCDIIFIYSGHVPGPIPNLGLILFFAVLGGLIVTARLYLKAHSLKEVLLGMVIGFTGIYVCVKYGLYV